MFTDYTFFGRNNILFWNGYQKFDNIFTTYHDFFRNMSYWARLSERYPSIPLFGKDETLMLAPVQSTYGDCYFLAALTAVAVYPDMVKKLFVDAEANA